MDTEHYKKLLLEKKTSLTREMGVWEDQAREGINTDVEDAVDAGVSTEAKSMGFEQSEMDYRILQMVDDALSRINDGTYGRCIDCDKMIEPARLEAVPWTPYCIDDQRKHDAENPVRESTI